MSPITSDRRDLLRFLRRLAILLAAIALLVVVGTLGFVLTTDKGVWYSFIWSLDTVATLGSIPAPPQVAAQVVKVLLLVLGVGTLFYALVTVTEFFVAGHLGELLAERRMQKMIDSLTDHYIICGFGRVGRQVARDLRAAGGKYVVVDSTPENRETAAETGVRFIAGDPGEDDVLRQAGIERARAVLACVDSDAANIFIALTARQLRQDIEIIARASVEDSEKKLLRAGADRVISPYKSSGTEMARYALHPQVARQVDVAPEYRLEEIEVSEGCAGVGQSIGEIRGGATIVALKRADGGFLPLPSGEERLEVCDVLLAMGTARTMDRLEGIFDAPVKVVGR